MVEDRSFPLSSTSHRLPLLLSISLSLSASRRGELMRGCRLDADNAGGVSFVQSSMILFLSLSSPLFFALCPSPISSLSPPLPLPPRGARSSSFALVFGILGAHRFLRFVLRGHRETRRPWVPSIPPLVGVEQISSSLGFQNSRFSPLFSYAGPREVFSSSRGIGSFFTVRIPRGARRWMRDDGAVDRCLRICSDLREA